MRDALFALAIVNTVGGVFVDPTEEEQVDATVWLSGLLRRQLSSRRNPRLGSSRLEPRLPAAVLIARDDFLRANDAPPFGEMADFGTRVARTLEAEAAADTVSAVDADLETLGELSEEAEAETLLLSQEREAELHAALGALTERQRTVLKLTYFDEAGTDEIALALGVAPGTIKATRHQAINSLRQRLRV